MIERRSTYSFCVRVLVSISESLLLPLSLEFGINTERLVEISHFNPFCIVVVQPLVLGVRVVL